MMGDPFQTIRTQWEAAGPLFESAGRQPSGPAFVERYGRLFSDDRAVEALQTALADLACSIESLGGPHRSRSRRGLPEDSGWISGRPAPGEDAWVGVVNLANETREASAALIRILESIPSLLSDDVEASALHVRQALCGPDGVATAGNRARDLAEALRDRICATAKAMEPALEVLVASDLLNHASRNVLRLSSQIQKLESEPELQSAKEALNLNQAYCAGFRGMDLKANAVIPALQRICEVLDALIRQFATTRETLTSVCTLASAAQLARQEWIFRALSLPELLESWRRLNEQAERFVRATLPPPAEPPAQPTRGG